LGMVVGDIFVFITSRENWSVICIPNYKHVSNNHIHFLNTISR
jgi:hypothetical protein